jgi:hypothetical protein
MVSPFNPNVDPYNGDMQRVLLAYLIEDIATFNECRKLVKDEYFDDNLRRAVRLITTYFDETGTLPPLALVNRSDQISRPR